MRFPALLLCLTLAGCSVGEYEYSKETLDRVDMTVTGIPTILGLGSMGTTIPLTRDYSLTAAHVASFSLYKVKARHPTCDLAVVYHKNKQRGHQPPLFRNGKIGDKVTLYGYSFYTAMPVTSRGVNLVNTSLKNKWNQPSCTVVATSAGVVQGMSGGAVYNVSDNSIAGVTVGYTRQIKDKTSGKQLYDNVSLYVPYSQFADWLSDALKE